MINLIKIKCHTFITDNKIKHYHCLMVINIVRLSHSKFKNMYFKYKINLPIFKQNKQIINTSYIKQSINHQKKMISKWKLC